jgi:hypothetical protein
MASPGTVLDARALGRALLHRQWLVERRAATPLDAVEHLVALQAQSGDAPYYQLWSRLTGFTTDDLSALLTDRRAVRVVLMRGTIHLVGARDALRLRAVVQPYLDKTLFSTTAGRKLTGVDPAELADAARAALAAGPLPGDELGARLAVRWPEGEPNDLAYLARSLLPLVQVPPRGVWGASGGLVYAHADQYLGAPSATDPAPDETVLRYLAAYGPASVADTQKWLSLTGLKAVFDRLRPRLVTYRDATGRELFDLVGTELPDPDVPVPPMLLGPFDNVLLAHADRTRIIDKADERRVFTANGIVRGTLLLDGRVAGVWQPELKRTSAAVDLRPFAPLSGRDRDRLAAAAEDLLAFAAPGAEKTEVRFGAPA